jgi:alpha-L-rhamnosidase
MKITSMKCNRIVNPLGFELTNPVLSWIMEGEDAKEQFAAQVEVAFDEAFRNLVYDSGKDKDIDSIGYTPGLELTPRTRYYWRVRVWTDGGEVSSPAAWFETAKLSEAWSGKWITPGDSIPTGITASEETPMGSSPFVRKSFPVQKEVLKARLYLCGLGLYEAELNGRRVGDEYLTPYCNSYNNWIQYQTFDITELLEKGNNVLGVLLGNGWYKGRFGFQEKIKGCYGSQFALLSELVITYTDGTEESISTDESWKTAQSHILDSTIYDGEVQDARRYIPDWSTAKVSDENWQRVQYIDLDYRLLSARRSLPVRIKEKRKPVKVIHTPKGETVLDMGQNMVGWLSFTVKAPAGTEIKLQYGEELQEGCFYRENLRSAKAEFKYISDGETAIVQPHFTFYGFRYVKVEGWPYELKEEDFTGCVVYSDIERTGNIETSNPMVNRLFLNALWGQKGNFLDVPTDCPQRDERMGWTGDAQMFSGTACMNMDCDAFFSKYLYDLAKEQESLGGIVPHTVPSFDLSHVGENSFLSGGSSAWSEAATVIPWNLYLHYGDKAILKQQLNSMKAYVDYIKGQDDGSRLWNTGFHFGDWLALDGQGEYDPFGGTPTDLIATAYYAYSSELLSKAAAVLGLHDMAEEYGRLSSEVKEAFCEEFLTKRGRMAADTQTAYILALFMELVPDNYKERITKDLLRNLEENKYYLKTGFVGTPYFCRALSENGHNSMAYTLLLNEEFPSWLYEVKLGATTIWERWNSLLPDGKFGELGMNSLNHYTYGSIVEWMYRNMCGINPTEENPGYRKIKLAPKPDNRLQYAKATLHTAAGLYESGWCYEENELHYQFTIPFHSQAELILTNADSKDITINGVSLEKWESSHQQQGSDVTVRLKTGKYEVIQTIPAMDSQKG